jgi:hypothetical protein
LPSLLICENESVVGFLAHHFTLIADQNDHRHAGEYDPGLSARRGAAFSQLYSALFAPDVGELTGQGFGKI